MISLGDFAVTGWRRGGGCLFHVFLVSDTGVGGVGLGSFSGLPFPGSSDSSVLVSSRHSKGFEWGAICCGTCRSMGVEAE